MKNVFILVFLLSIGTNAMASNLSIRGPKVQAWVNGLPAVSSLHGEDGCDAISFSTDSDGLTDLKLGKKLSQGWLGIEGDVQINSTSLTQDYSGGGIDSSQYHIQLQLEKSGSQLTSVQYRYYKVTGFIFKREELVKIFDCRL